MTRTGTGDVSDNPYPSNEQRDPVTDEQRERTMDRALDGVDKPTTPDTESASSTGDERE